MKQSLHLTLKDSCKAYDTLHDQPTAQTGDDAKLSLKNVLEHTTTGRKVNVIARINIDKMMKLQKSYVFCKNILQHIDCNKFKNYFQDATGILHNKGCLLLTVYFQL